MTDVVRWQVGVVDELALVLLCRGKAAQTCQAIGLLYGWSSCDIGCSALLREALTPSMEEEYCTHAEVILQVGGWHTEERSMDIIDSLSDIELDL